MVGHALTQGGVEGAPAVQRVVKGEWEDEEGTGLLAQMIQVEVQRGLVQGVTFVLLIEHSTHLHINQRSVQQVGGSKHEARLALVLANHGLGAELDGSRSLLGTCNLGYKRT